ncbi:hypothetical protein [Umezawaea beigongshangensis]|uniref:hypothetical protein n=1 Tax=Umezawaea beigongshangensis TaxID=2780383 RepID=UPI0018F12573|nr:hypothetical protein [Umezawaea beigongshangensis]
MLQRERHAPKVSIHALIVIGLRRRSPWARCWWALLVGSSAQRVLLDADRPVLAVEPRP